MSFSIGTSGTESAPVQKMDMALGTSDLQYNSHMNHHLNNIVCRLAPRNSPLIGLNATTHLK